MPKQLSLPERNVMALSRKRIIDMFADMLDDYIEKQSDNIHTRIKANAC